jgi:hypothetical protein
MDFQLAASPSHVFVAGVSMFFLGGCLTFLGHYRRRPKRFDVWEFAVVPFVLLAVLLWGYWAIEIDRDYSLGLTILGLVVLLIVGLPLGGFGIALWLFLGFYALRYGGAALDLVGVACVGILGGCIAGYLTAVLWRSIPPGPE